MTYSDFKSFKVKNDFDLVNFNISENIRNKKYLENIKKYYIDSQKLIQFVAAKVGQNLYINSQNESNNILLEYSRTVSYRYFDLIKAFCKEKFNNPEEALRFFISFYICEEDENGIKNFGNLGSNPLAWINLLEKKRNNLSTNESEFRNRLYFVYKIRDFINLFFKHLNLENRLKNQPKKICFDKNYFDNNYNFERINRGKSIKEYWEFEKEIYEINIFEINKHLLNWKLDKNFIKYLFNRLNDDKNLDGLTPKYNPIVYQFGEAARQNYALRTNSRSEKQYKENEEKIWKDYNTKDSNNKWKISYNEAKKRSDENKYIFETTQKINNYKKNEYILPSYNDIYISDYKYKSPFMVFDTKLSDKEIFALLGELPSTFKSTINPNNFNQINYNMRNYAYNPGAIYYFYKEKIDQSKHPFAYQFYNLSKENHLPVVSGISGSMDLSLTMASLVGLGLKNGKTDLNYLQTIKLVYVVWMGLGYDHTLHEMLYSSKSFGLEYKPGPNIAKYIYPNDPKFIEEIEKEMKKFSYLLPNIYCAWFDAIRKDSDTLNNHVKNTIKIIAKCEALGRLLRNDNYYYQNDIYKELIGLKNPNEGIFGKNVPNPINSSRDIIYNPQTKKEEYRYLPIDRNTNKDRKFTKKLSTTLIRPDGNINFYNGIEATPVGFIHNIYKVNNKNWKYVFKSNASTNLKWWVKPLSKTCKEKSKLYIEIDKLRKVLLNNSKNHIGLNDYNELLVGLSKESFCGMFAPERSDTHIISLISAYILVKNILNIHFIPTFIFNKRYCIDLLSKKRPIISVLTFEEAISVIQREKEKNTKEFKYLNYCMYNNLADEYLKIKNEVYIERIKSILITLFVNENDRKYLEEFYISELNNSYKNGIAISF
jgi:hypothetical protein